MRPLALFTAAALLTGCAAPVAPVPGDPPPVPEVPAGAAERAAVPAGVGRDWPTLLGENGDGVCAETGILTAWPKDGLKKLWDAPLGTGYAPPTVAGGRLFHADQTGPVMRLTCRNAATGELVWVLDTKTEYDDQYGYDPGPRAAPVVAAGRVFVHGVDGQLTAADAVTGTLLWRADTRAVYRFHPNFFGVGSVPVVVGDTLVVPVGGSPKGPRPADLRDARGDGTALVGFDPATGKEKWRAGDDLASYSAPVVRALGGKPHVLYFGRGGLTGVDPAAGKVQFFHPYRSKLLESVNAANPVVVGDDILLSECYENGSVLLKYAAGKLSPVWADAAKERGDKSLQSHWCTPVAHDKHVYGCHGRNPTDAELRCVDRATGAVAWSERRTARCTVVTIDGHLLSLNEQGQLRLIKLDPAKYTEVARWDVPTIGYPSWAPPVVSRGRLYLRGVDAENPKQQRLVCYELAPAGK